MAARLAKVTLERTGVIASAREGDGGSAAPAGDDRVFRLAVLASGSGSNLQAIIDQLHGRLSRSWTPTAIWRRGPGPGAARSGAKAPRRAAAPTAAPRPSRSSWSSATCRRAGARPGRAGGHPHRAHPGRATSATGRSTTWPWSRRLCEAEPDLVVLAGYMRMVSPSLLTAFPWRVINLHPALLPAFPGTTSIERRRRATGSR